MNLYKFGLMNFCVFLSGFEK